MNEEPVPAEETKEGYDYREHNYKKFLFVTILTAIAAVAVFADLYCTTCSYMSFTELIKAIFTPDRAERVNVLIVREIQAPIAVIGILCGATFGFAGAVMQTMMNNPLASPYTLGISSGASLGAALAIAFGASALAIGYIAIPAFAFCFSMIICVFIFFISKRQNFNATILILAGVGIVQLFSALQSMLQYFIDSETLRNITFWTMGSLEKATWKVDALILVLFVVIFIYLYRKSWCLTAMRLGDNKARSLGIDVGNLRKQMFVLISILTAATVSFVGAIGFIGIVAPHICRMIVGEDQRYLLISSALLGACILEIADILSKTITVGIVYPVGIITAVIGLPFYFSLLLKKKAIM